jgi:hypothetical protein
MELIRRFWDAAAAVDPASASLDEAVRFPICAPGPLRDLVGRAGLEDTVAHLQAMMTAGWTQARP